MNGRSKLQARQQLGWYYIKLFGRTLATLFCLALSIVASDEVLQGYRGWTNKEGTLVPGWED